MEEKYEAIIGLEVHIELDTKSKMFCGCKNDPFFARDPNMYTCPVCLGLPGGLPVPNKKAIEYCMLLGLALNCDIPKESKFDRKNYFYPDLPKGYQITQYDQPFAINGSLELSNYPINKLSNNPIKKTIRIRRVHMEEDTGKLIHETVDGKHVSLVDFNRSGVPLVEIVTEPDFRSIEEVDAYVKKLQQIVRYLGISGADLEKGSMRLEPSISIRTQNTELNDQQLPPYRVEIKNINSFRFVRKAIEAEIDRQIQNPNERYQETRRYDEKSGTTILMRSKEQAEDYRYFPEPDIPPIVWTQYDIDSIKKQMPELPDAKKNRFINDYALNDYDTDQLTQTKALAEYFEEAVKAGKSVDLSPKIVANWIMNKKPDIEKTLPAHLVEEIRVAKEVVAVGGEVIEQAIAKIIAEHEKAVADYRNGKEAAVMFLFGMVNKELKGKGEKSEILKLLKEKLTT